MSVKVTGLAQKLGQLEAVNRDLQPKSRANLNLLGQPCNFYAMLTSPLQGERPGITILLVELISQQLYSAWTTVAKQERHQRPTAGVSLYDSTFSRTAWRLYGSYKGLVMWYYHRRPTAHRPVLVAVRLVEPRPLRVGRLPAAVRQVPSPGAGLSL
jgi:hypothetical protein